MNKIVISKKALSSKARKCPCCGFNTNLLSVDEKVCKDDVFYCLNCSDSTNKRLVTQGDFYSLFFRHSKEGDSNKRLKTEVYVNKMRLPSIEIAHLCGGKYSNYVYLDMYCDIEKNKVYLRLCCSSDDEDEDGWYRTETSEFISIEEAINILNKNDIHFFDGLTTENINEFLIFE